MSQQLRCPHCKQPITECPECHRPLTESPSPTLRDFLASVADTLVHFNQSLFAALRDVFRPAALAAQFFSPHSRPSYPLFRLFFLSALLYLSTVFYTNQYSQQRQDVQQALWAQQHIQWLKHWAKTHGSPELQPHIRSLIDSIERRYQSTPRHGPRATNIVLHITPILQFKINIPTPHAPAADKTIAHFIQLLGDYFIVLFIVLLPLYAFILQLLFRKSAFSYLHHLILTTQMLSACFLALTFELWLYQLLPQSLEVFKSVVSLTLYIALLTYLVVSLRRFYAIGWKKLAVRAFAFVFLSALVTAMATLAFLLVLFLLS